MNIQALIQAAQGGDPQAAQFIQQLLSGGTPMAQRMPEIERQELVVPEFAESSENSGMGKGAGELASALGGLPAFDGVRARLDEMRDGWFNRDQAAGQPTQQQQMANQVMGAGAPAPQGDPGMLGQMEGPQPLPPGSEVSTSTLPPPGQEQGGEDLISLLGRLLGKGGA